MCISLKNFTMLTAESWLLLCMHRAMMHESHTQAHILSVLYMYAILMRICVVQEDSASAAIKRSTDSIGKRLRASDECLIISNRHR